MSGAASRQETTADRTFRLLMNERLKSISFSYYPYSYYTIRLVSAVTVYRLSVGEKNPSLTHRLYLMIVIYMTTISICPFSLALKLLRHP